MVGELKLQRAELEKTLDRASEPSSMSPLCLLPLSFEAARLSPLLLPPDRPQWTYNVV